MIEDRTIRDLTGTPSMVKCDRRIHILNQFVWPDWAPTAVYAEQLAQELHRQGLAVALVGGKGAYRASARPKPALTPVLLEHRAGNRKNLFSVFLEYFSITRAFRAYIENEVSEGDLVIVTSAPPLSLFLHRTIRRKRAGTIYWLQDYYPELLRSIAPLEALWLGALKRFWNGALSRWDHVVKISANLDYDGPNARVIRNWATLRFQAPLQPPAGKAALYTGNLGYAHDVPEFVAMCEGLRRRGYEVRVRGDGVGLSKLPDWIRVGPPFTNEDELRNACLEAEILLVAADPRIQGALFPSKFWNCLASGRAVEASGFAGTMKAELDASLGSSPYAGLEEWRDWLAGSAAAADQSRPTAAPWPSSVRS